MCCCIYLNYKSKNVPGRHLGIIHTHFTPAPNRSCIIWMSKKVAERVKRIIEKKWSHTLKSVDINEHTRVLK